MHVPRSGGRAPLSWRSLRSLRGTLLSRSTGQCRRANAEMFDDPYVSEAYRRRESWPVGASAYVTGAYRLRESHPVGGETSHYAFVCLSGARPSRVYVRCVEGLPESFVPAAKGHGTRPCRLEVVCRCTTTRAQRSRAPAGWWWCASGPRCVASWVRLWG